MPNGDSSNPAHVPSPRPTSETLEEKIRRLATASRDPRGTWPSMHRREVDPGRVEIAALFRRPDHAGPTLASTGHPGVIGDGRAPAASAHHYAVGPGAALVSGAHHDKIDDQAAAGHDGQHDTIDDRVALPSDAHYQVNNGSGRYGNNGPNATERFPDGRVINELASARENLDGGVNLPPGFHDRWF